MFISIINLNDKNYELHRTYREKHQCAQSLKSRKQGCRKLYRVGLKNLI